MILRLGCVDWAGAARAAVDAHLCRDETAAKMGHPGYGFDSVPLAEEGSGSAGTPR